MRKCCSRFGYKLTFVLTPALAVAMAQQAAAKQDTVLVNRVGPSSSAPYIANIDGSFEYDASFSSDGQWIVFTSERSGSSDIYRAHSDRSGLERLTDDPGFDDQAVFSPDGKHLTFVSARGAGRWSASPTAFSRPSSMPTASSRLSPTTACAVAYLGTLSCSDQLDTHVMDFIARLRPRRHEIVDEELGIVQEWLGRIGTRPKISRRSAKG